MERQELLNQLNALLENYENHKAFADKAREQASSFSSSVIEKVIADHQIKASLVADDITPLLPQLNAEIAEIESAKATAESSKGDLGVRIEELELRKLIGEISDEEFESLSSEGRGTVEAADQELESLDAQHAELTAALNKWNELSGGAAEVAPVEAVHAPVEESDEVDPVVDSILPGFEDADVGDESVEIESDDGSERVDDVEENADVAFAIDEDDIEASVDVVPADEEAPAAVQVQIDDSSVDEIGVDASEDASAGDEGDDASRRAILLSNEGTPDEQIYALTGDVFTIGRGRDNDLQIKNDSKVSRFHCKLYRRAANFYLEDNKSSNGTMVNGELISERRLFGGEELVIGETFVRFRVM